MLPDDAHNDENSLTLLPGIERIRDWVREGQSFFYTHALTEAKKDGVTPSG